MKAELNFPDEEKKELAAEITDQLLNKLRPLMSNARIGEDQVFDVQELAHYLKSKPKWVYQHVHELPHFKKDGLLRFKKSQIDKLFELPKSS